MVNDHWMLGANFNISYSSQHQHYISWWCCLGVQFGSSWQVYELYKICEVLNSGNESKFLVSLVGLHTSGEMTKDKIWLRRPNLRLHKYFVLEGCPNSKSHHKLGRIQLNATSEKTYSNQTFHRTTLHW